MSESEIHEIVSVANNILEGNIGSIEASRKLIALFYDAGLDNDDDLAVFKALDSQTDHLPINKLRENYSSERLEEIDEEVKQYENFYRDAVMKASRNIIEKYSLKLMPAD